MSKRHMGSSIDDFLKEEGIFEEARVQAISEVVAWQVNEAQLSVDQLQRGPSRRSAAKP
jgi:hypothetical protein